MPNLNYKYPYIPKKYYSAVMFACWYIRKYKSYPKAVRLAAVKYGVSEEGVNKHLRARIEAGRKAKRESLVV